MEKKLSSIDHERIVEAIRSAEKKTSGELRVVISRSKVEDPLAAAKKHFERLGMTRTAARNGVLIFVAPESHTFAVIGDAGVHEKCGDGFWQHLTETMTEHFRKGEFETAIVLGVARAGALLAQHFPLQAGDRNELSDDVDHAD